MLDSILKPFHKIFQIKFEVATYLTLASNCLILVHIDISCIYAETTLKTYVKLKICLKSLQHI